MEAACRELGEFLVGVSRGRTGGSLGWQQEEKGGREWGARHPPLWLERQGTLCRLLIRPHELCFPPNLPRASFPGKGLAMPDMRLARITPPPQQCGSASPSPVLSNISRNWLWEKDDLHPPRWKIRPFSGSIRFPAERSCCLPPRGALSLWMEGHPTLSMEETTWGHLNQSVTLKGGREEAERLIFE